MANETTFSALSGTYGEEYLLLSEAALSARYAHDNVRDVVLTRDIGSMPTTTVRFRKKPVLAASSIGDGVDLVNFTQYNPTQTPVTVGNVGLKLILTDLARTSSYADDTELAQNAGEAVLEKMNTDVCALGSGFSNSIGSTGNNLTETLVEDALVTLAGNRAPGALFGILHPQQMRDLIDDIGTTIAAGIGGAQPREASNDLTRGILSGMAGMLYNVDWRTNPLVPTANAGADRYGFIGVKQRTIGMALKWAIRPEFERDASYLGTEAVVSSSYGVVEVEDETGVGVLSDA